MQSSLGVRINIKPGMGKIAAVMRNRDDFCKEIKMPDSIRLITFKAVFFSCS
jgi:hypothetical protein